MKNIFGKEESLKLYDGDNNKIYEYYINSRGFSCEYTYNKNGNLLTYKDSKGYSSEFTRDKNGNELTYKNSKGVKRGFDIPEYTMEQLVEKLGNFKIKK